MKEITSKQNPLVKHWVKLRKDRAYRYEQKRVFIEGKKMVAEAKNILARISCNPTTKDAVIVTPEIFEKITQFRSHEGIAAEVVMPEPADLTDVSRLLILDNISDPGNLGTLLCSALAFGWEAAFLLGNCCDPFNDKALTASRGAALKLPLFIGDNQQLSRCLKENGLRCFIAELEGLPINELGPVPKAALLLGHEGHGPNAASQSLGERVTIPIGRMESLNVAAAGAILMYAIGGKP